jgi:hypothetical protein
MCNSAKHYGIPSHSTTLSHSQDWHTFYTLRAKLNTMSDKNQYPGYPHYPANQDITQHADKVTLKEEADTTDATNKPAATDNDADVTAEDLQVLDAAGNNMDTTDAANLQQSVLDNIDDDGDPLNEEAPGDLAGGDLDVPGSEDDDADEAIGEEDEENNYYSLGGDNHEDLEENKGE